MSKGTELAKAYVQIIPSAQGISGSISNVLNGEASAAGDSAGTKIGSGLVSKIKGVLAAAGIGVAIKKSLLEGADLQQSLGGIETLFKDSADKVIASAKNAYKTAGMSANEYMETVTSFSASLLQGLSGDTNKAAEVADMALVDMSDNANKMGTSMELIQNAYQGFAKQNYTMLDNLKLGYGGTKTEMERLLADAQKISGVKYDISNLSDVYSAIHVIQEEMGITGTTAKEASETFSGSLASMKAAASNVLGNLSLGEDIGPSLKALGETTMTFVKGNLIPMLWNIVSSVPELISGAVDGLFVTLGELFSSAGTILGESTSFLESGKLMVENLINSISTQLPLLLEQGTSFVTTLVDGIVSGIPGLLETGGELLNKFVTSYTELCPQVWESGTELLLNVVNGIKDNLPTIVDTAVSVVDNLLTTICENAPQMLDAGIEVLQKLLDGIIEALPDILSAAADLVVELLKTVLKYAPKLIEGGITLLGKLAAGLIKAIPDLLGKIPGIISDIKEKFTSVNWGELGKNVIKGIAKGLGNAASEVVKSMKEVATKALNAFKEKLGIHSPSRVFEDEGGKEIDRGVAKGVKNNTSSIIDSMKEMSRATIGAFDADFSYDFNGFGSNLTTNGETFGKLEQLYMLLDRYLPELANMQLVTDTGTLVGELMPKTNLSLNEIMTQSERGM